jgi:hypothetical protein
MLYQKAVVKDNKVVITESKEIDQNTLTSDCWLIQFNGLSACKDCEVKNTPECGGGRTLTKMQTKPLE